MIVSVSRRTDIPCYFHEWFVGRLKAGYARVCNPFNAHQVRRVSLLPEDVDCFVFWSKDPGPMLPLLDTVDMFSIPYYFQFTLTPYGRDLEPNLRDKQDIVDTFVTLSQRIGPQRVLWRYDPIVLNGALTPAWHEEAFLRLCDRLAPHTPGVAISFVDAYAKVHSAHIQPISPEAMLDTAGRLSRIATDHGLLVWACCEALDFSGLGIARGACIDGRRIAMLTGRCADVGRDPSQRPGCGCVRSVDIGVYNTCLNGCVYCYANHSLPSIQRNVARHRQEADMLIPASDQEVTS